jgi:hypothetical protein
LKLLDLNPHWYVATEGGSIVGFTFDCPHCPEGDRHRLAVAVHEDGLIDPEPGNPRCWPPGYVWQMSGVASLDQSGFVFLTLTPSVDASKAGHWHGFITNGEIK